MILSISGVVLLGIIVFLFFRKDGLKASHALVAAAVRLLPGQHRHRAEHQGRRREPGRPPRRDQVLTRPRSPPTHHLQETAVARRPLPRILSNGSAHHRPEPGAGPDGGRQRHRRPPPTDHDRARTAPAGLGRAAQWADTPKDRRGPLLFLVASVVLVVLLLPYGPLLAVVTLMAAAAWQGRDRAAGRPAPTSRRPSGCSRCTRPSCRTSPSAGDPDPLYAHGGEWEKAFPAYEFDGDGRVSTWCSRYPAYFTDGEAESRARIEQLLHAKSGRGREYHFAWDEEGNQLTVQRPRPAAHRHRRPALRHRLPARRSSASPTRDAVQRTLPLTHGEEQRDVPPVVWRTGVRSTEPHLLAAGQPGSGTTTLLRSIALQALQHGDVAHRRGRRHRRVRVPDRPGRRARRRVRPGRGAGEPGVGRARDGAAADRRQPRPPGRAIPPPDDTKRPLWILLDRPSVLGHLAAADGRQDPQSLLQVPLRHGRAANVTVVVADQFDSLDTLSDAVRQHTRARVVLGPAHVGPDGGRPRRCRRTPPRPGRPPGRGYARLGAGPVHRLQVPATPDPYDDATSDATGRRYSTCSRAAGGGRGGRCRSDRSGRGDPGPVDPRRTP